MSLAFAQGPVVWREDFSYTDAASINGVGGWIAPGVSGDIAMGVATGALQRTTGSGWSAAITGHQGFGRTPGFDITFDIAAPPDSTNQVFCQVLAGGNGVGTTGYVANIKQAVSANSQWKLQRFAAGSVAATHVDVTDAVLAAGDAIGIRVMPGTVALWRRLSGTWAQVGGTATDTTLTAGTIAVETNAGATRIDAITVRRTEPILVLVGCGA